MQHDSPRGPKHVALDDTMKKVGEEGGAHKLRKAHTRARTRAIKKTRLYAICPAAPVISTFTGSSVENTIAPLLTWAIAVEQGARHTLR